MISAYFSTRKWLVALILGALVPCVIALIYLTLRKNDPQEQMFERAARVSNMPMQDYKKFIAELDHVFLSGSITDAQWEYLTNEYRIPGRQTNVIATLANVKPPSRRQEEIVRLAQEYIGRADCESKFLGLKVLSNFKVAGWREQAMAVINEPRTNSNDKYCLETYLSQLDKSESDRPK